MEGSIVQVIYPRGFGVLLRRDVEGHENIIFFCENCSRGKQRCSSKCYKYYVGHCLQHLSLVGSIGEENHRMVKWWNVVTKIKFEMAKWWNGVTTKWWNGEMVKLFLINSDMVKPRMNDSGASEWCMFGILVVRSLYYLLSIIRQEEWKKDVCDKTIQCCTLWCSVQPFLSLLWVLFPSPFYAGGTNGIRTGGSSFVCKKGGRV